MERNTPTGTRRYRLVVLVVVAVALVLLTTSIAIAPFTMSTQRAREAVLKEDLYRMRDAVDQYYKDKSRYPISLSDLVDENYLRDIPKDPMTDSHHTWVVKTTDGRVYDVKSGSDATARDGSKYADWD